MIDQSHKEISSCHQLDAALVVNMSHSEARRTFAIDPKPSLAYQTMASPSINCLHYHRQTCCSHLLLSHPFCWHRTRTQACRDCLFCTVRSV